MSGTTGHSQARSRMHSRLCGWNPGANFGCRGGPFGPAASWGEEGLLSSGAGALSGRGGRRKHLLHPVARCRVAFAGDFFHRLAVEDVDQAAAVADETRALPN